MNKKIQRVYIAGALSPNGSWSSHAAIDYICNRREMIRWALKSFLAGYDPFCPAFDMEFWMQADGQPITEAMIKRYSKSWVEVCDAVVLTPGWQQSPGTIAEIKHARIHDIPVFASLDNLIVGVEMR